MCNIFCLFRWLLCVRIWWLIFFLSPLVLVVFVFLIWCLFVMWCIRQICLACHHLAVQDYFTHTVERHDIAYLNSKIPQHTSNLVSIPPYSYKCAHSKWGVIPTTERKNYPFVSTYGVASLPLFVALLLCYVCVFHSQIACLHHSQSSEWNIYIYRSEKCILFAVAMANTNHINTLARTRTYTRRKKTICSFIQQRFDDNNTNSNTKSFFPVLAISIRFIYYTWAISRLFTQKNLLLVFFFVWNASSDQVTEKKRKRDLLHIHLMPLSNL